MKKYTLRECTLSKLDYTVSHNFSATTDDIFEIFRILKALKAIIMGLTSE